MAFKSRNSLGPAAVWRRLPRLVCLMLFTFAANATAQDAAALPAELVWPKLNSECRPWAYSWWMGSAVDEENVRRQLQLYRQAGMGGVHLIPIYGAKGYEKQYIEYLSPKWMAMLRCAVEEAARLGMGVDMTTGTGWCFGGPNVPASLANARVHRIKQKLPPGARIDEKFGALQTAIAFGPAGQRVDLAGRIGADGRIDWPVPEGEWTLWAVWQAPSGRQVKRAAPGGEGHMLNPFCGEAVRVYLKRFDEAFADYGGPMPRAMYHDSYEYVCDWSPDLFEEFARRRGYLLQHELPALFGEGDPERCARVKCDYRRTVSDMMIENFTRTWAAWVRAKGCLTRDQAHGSPGNLLDIYAECDIPETEFFRHDRNPLVAKLASSAAHVADRRLTACETGTWLQEHFNVSLAHLKPFIDGLFVSGVNHVIYHGTCYSPAGAPWPGWVFYASTQMNPRNSIWHDVPALNAYIARCQSILQAGQPDNDVLLYWPIHDLWHNPKGMVRKMTVHRTGWLQDEPIGKTALQLWQRGYCFDYVSDRQLLSATVQDGRVRTTGASYRAVLLPPCRHMPVETAQSLRRLSEQGASVLFQEALPADVPGLGRLDERRRDLAEALGNLPWREVDAGGAKARVAIVGKGRFLVGGDAESLLQLAGVLRERMVDHRGVRFVRRADDAGRFYFVTNQHEQFERDPGTEPVDGWLRLSVSARSVAIMDPLTGKTGLAAIREAKGGGTDVYVQLAPGQSLILRTLTRRGVQAPAWTYRQPAGESVDIGGPWEVSFLQGGPELPAAFVTPKPASWTNGADPEAQRFAGTARYATRFDAPAGGRALWRLELGRVAESARVRLNGRELGTAFCNPFSLDLPEGVLRPTGNLLEIEVTNLSANRIRDLDRRNVQWRVFHNINFVNVNYRKFDASDWPVRDSGLLGPVQLLPQKRMVLR